MDSATLATFLKKTTEDEQIPLSGTVGRTKLQLIQPTGAKLDVKLTVLDTGSC